MNVFDSVFVFQKLAELISINRPSLHQSSVRFFSLAGRTISASGATGPFRAFPKSLSVDFGGVNPPQAQPLPQSLSQQHHHQKLGGVGQAAPAPPVGGTKAQDRYAAVLQLDSVFCDTPSTTGGKCLTLFYKMCLTELRTEELITPPCGGGA